MNKIPTAEAFIQGKLWIAPREQSTTLERGDVHDTDERVAESHIEFAKLHVKAALEAAKEKCRTEVFSPREISASSHMAKQIKDSILNAYPNKLII